MTEEKKGYCHNVAMGHMPTRAYCSTYAAAVKLNNNNPDVCLTCSAFVKPKTKTVDFFIKRNALDKALKEMQDKMEASRGELTAGCAKAKTLRAEVNAIAKVRNLLCQVRSYDIPDGADA